MMDDMNLPDWRTSTKGTRVRAALWLLSEVGEGGAFTKGQLREAFPGVEQIDRRMRDLRTEGWVLATYREDRSLSQDELRLVQVGGAVWDPTYQSKAQSSLSDKERQNIFAADDYMCVYCGVSGGESYVDDPLRTVKLTISRVQSVDGQSVQLATCCDRCHVATREDTATADLGPDIGALSEAQRSRLLLWVRNGTRSMAPEERLWAQYRRLPHAARLEVRRHLEAKDV
jgi:5-methylcytosine-specific restriction endonuclease McrA